MDCTYLGDLLIFTVSTNETDGFKRYMQSAEAYDLSVNVSLGNSCNYYFINLFYLSTLLFRSLVWEKDGMEVT